MANHVQLTAGIIMRECIQHSRIQDTQNLFININNNIITHMGVLHLWAGLHNHGSKMATSRTLIRDSVISVRAEGGTVT